VIFWEEKHLEYIARFPRHSPKEVNREINRAWDELEHQKKEPYIEKAKQDVRRYEEEKKKFELKKQQNQNEDESEERPRKKENPVL